MSASLTSRLAAVAAASLLTGCAVYSPRTELEPGIELRGSFLDTGVEAPDRWWEDFDDPELTRLIEAALEGNLSLRMAWSRLDQVRAPARIAGAGRYPNTDLAAAAPPRRTAAGRWSKNGSTPGNRFFSRPRPRWKTRWSPSAASSRPTASSPPVLTALQSLQARFLIPMAISLGFGILFATMIALVIIPCLYLALVDLKRLV